MGIRARRAGDDRDRQPVGGEAGRVVDQRLALEDRLRAAGDAEPVEHGGGGDGVGGPSTAPSTNAAAHGMPSTAFATAATAAIVTSTSPTASRPIGFQLSLSSVAETAIDAA